VNKHFVTQISLSCEVDAVSVTGWNIWPHP